MSDAISQGHDMSRGRHATAGAVFRIWVNWMPAEVGWWQPWMGGNACDGDTRGSHVVNAYEVRRGTGLLPDCERCLELWREAERQAKLHFDRPSVGAIVPGRWYRNLKTGNLYRVASVATHSESLEPMVVYERERAGGWECWVRPLELFLSKFTPEAPAPSTSPPFSS